MLLRWLSWPWKLLAKSKSPYLPSFHSAAMSTMLKSFFSVTAKVSSVYSYLKMNQSKNLKKIEQKTYISYFANFYKKFWYFLPKFSKFHPTSLPIQPNSFDFPFKAFKTNLCCPHILTCEAFHQSVVNLTRGCSLSRPVSPFLSSQLLRGVPLPLPHYHLRIKSVLHTL